MPKARAEARRPRRGARGEAPQPPRGVGCGEGVSPYPLGGIFSIVTTFGASWGLFYGLVDCFGNRQPLHDSIMSVTVTGVITGS